eukprot:gene6057-8204_t
MRDNVNRKRSIVVSGKRIMCFFNLGLPLIHVGCGGGGGRRFPVIEHAREVWLAADHSKFNRPAMVELARLDDIDVVFTDQPPPPPFGDLLTFAVGFASEHAKRRDPAAWRPGRINLGS